MLILVSPPSATTSLEERLFGVLTTSALMLRDKKVNDERIQSHQSHAESRPYQRLDRQLQSPHCDHHWLPFTIREAMDLG
jgi:hypothetical protein